MLGSTTFLTLATMAGLLAGFAREWLLVAAWGAGAQTDAFLVAMFLPEALRTMLAGGLLSAACLPLWKETAESRQLNWLAGQVRHWLLLGVILALLLWLLSPWLVRVVGPGLSHRDSHQAGQALSWLSLVMPGLMVQAILTVPSQARGHFLLPGLGSLLFNLPVVLYLWMAGPQADASVVAQCFVGGSVLMAVVLLPAAWRLGWRPLLASNGDDVRQVWRQLWPLIASSGASQGLALLERLMASFLAEGSITIVNLARKLVNIPLIALMSLNQVLLGKMSGEDRGARRAMLDSGLLLCTLLTLPAAAGLISGASALVNLLLPQGLSHGPLPLMLALFAFSIVFGSWNALLARYYYAGGDTRTPLFCELFGSLLQAIMLLVLPWLLGIWGIAVAAMGGVISTGIFLTVRTDRRLLRQQLRLAAGAVLCCLAAACLLYASFGLSLWLQLGIATAYGALLLAGLGLRVSRSLR